MFELKEEYLPGVVVFNTALRIEGEFGMNLAQSSLYSESLPSTLLSSQASAHYSDQSLSITHINVFIIVSLSNL